MDQQLLIVWFAGFYEGEGSISNDISNRNRIRISISQNDITPLIQGQKIWGGNIYNRTRKSPLSDKMCYGHEWRLNHNKSLTFINDIKPFMIIPYKINQIETCLSKLNDKWDKKFKCSFCDNIYADMSGRRRHEKKEHIEKGVEHQCNHCDKRYKSKDSLNRHIKSIHK
jgi:hypothetical protein